MFVAARLGRILLLGGLCCAGAATAFAADPAGREQLEATHQYLKEVMVPEINCVVEHLPALAKADPAYPSKLREGVQALQACRQEAAAPALDRDSAALKSRLDSLIAEITRNSTRQADLQETINRLEGEKAASSSSGAAIQERIDKAREELAKLTAQYGAQEAGGAKITAEFRALSKKISQRLNEMAK